MILYQHRTSSASWRVRIALRLKGLEAQSVMVDLRRGENLAEGYARISALQQVPCLEVDGVRVTQSVAIVEYLDETHGEPRLLPKEPLARAAVREIVEAVNAGIQPLHNLAVLASLEEQLEAPREAVLDWARHWVERRLQGVERLLCAHAGEFAHGDALSAADVFLFPQLSKARDLQVAIEHYPTAARVEEQLRSIPAFVETSPEALPHG